MTAFSWCWVGMYSFMKFVYTLLLVCFAKLIKQWGYPNLCVLVVYDIKYIHSQWSTSQSTSQTVLFEMYTFILVCLQLYEEYITRLISVDLWNYRPNIFYV